MKNLALLILLVTISFSASSKDLVVGKLGEFFRIEANPNQGFQHPFFVYVPEDANRVRNLLVAPNNTGGSLTDLDIQIQDTMRKGFADAYVAERTRSVLLIPAFPRPNVEPPIYTHALSQSALLVKEGPLQRVDLQLIAMINAAREFLKRKYKIQLKKKFFLTGFSASASFVNRFSFLHPDIVAAAAVGAPGGWPIAPVYKFKGAALPYPVGINNMKDLIGKEIDFRSLKNVSFLFYIGDKDENDSVTFRDSFSKGDEDLIMRLFGNKPVERWPSARELYKDSGIQATFKVYPGIGHEVTREMREDVIKFLTSAMATE